MAGNVWEWVQSEFADYPYQADDGREDLTGTNERVTRSGMIYDSDFFLRAASRLSRLPTTPDSRVGFRCAR